MVTNTCISMFLTTIEKHGSESEQLDIIPSLHIKNSNSKESTHEKTGTLRSLKSKTL